MFNMSFSGPFDQNSAPLQEHDFLAAPSDLKLQQVPDAALPPMRAAASSLHDASGEDPTKKIK